jgi:hypothetical protein
VFLIVQHDVQQRAIAAQEPRHRSDEPGAQAVGVDSHPQRRASAGVPRGSDARQGRTQILLQHADLLHMPAQHAAGLGCPTWLPAHDQHATQALFQLLDALRDRRSCDAERPRRTFE